MAKLTLEELKNAIREEEEKASEKDALQREYIQAKTDTERARAETERAKAEKLRKDTKQPGNENRPPPKAKGDLTTIIFLVSIGASITATIAFFVLLIIKGRF